MKSQPNRAGVLSAGSLIARVPDRLRCVTVPCCHQRQQGRSSEFHSCSKCRGQTFPRSKVHLSVNRSTAGTQSVSPLSSTFLQVAPLPWYHHSFANMKTVLATLRETERHAWKVTASEHCSKRNRGHYLLHLLLPRRLTSDPGNKKCWFWFGRLIKYFSQCSTWIVPILLCGSLQIYY